MYCLDSSPPHPGLKTFSFTYSLCRFCFDNCGWIHGQDGTSAMFLLGPLCLSFARFLPNKQNRSSREPQNARYGPRNTKVYKGNISLFLHAPLATTVIGYMRFASIWMQLMGRNFKQFFSPSFLYYCILKWKLIKKNRIFNSY